jgi:predicted nucleic acid-binding protein
MDAVDANMLIYVAQGDARGRAVASLLDGSASQESLVGSLLLLPEVLSRPIRSGWDIERRRLETLLVRVDLKPVDIDTATISTELAAKYGLRAADAIHLATAVQWGADRFHTNNSKDFGQHIDEIEIVLP